MLAQQDSLERSFSKPEALRTTLPLTACPVAGAAAFRIREVALKCETFAFMQPRPKLMAPLLPHLKALQPFQRVVGVHLRTGYADWAYRNDDSYFATNATRPQSLLSHWATLDTYFRDCKRGQSGPCFNWLEPRHGHRPRHSDAMRCGGTRVRRTPPFPLGAPRGFLNSLMLCGIRIAQSLTSIDNSKRLAGKGGKREGTSSWGLLVLSDAPAIPSLAESLPSLAGRIVSTAASGQLGHSSFDRSCSTRSGCSLGADPGGAWTRSLVDFYLAGAADGFVKGLFTSFLFSTMRRNLLCCEPDAFVQWMAWCDKQASPLFP